MRPLATFVSRGQEVDGTAQTANKSLSPGRLRNSRPTLTSPRFRTGASIYRSSSRQPAVARSLLLPVGMGFFVQALFIGLLLLGVYEVMIPPCRQCHRRKPRWHDECRRCQQAAN